MQWTESTFVDPPSADGIPVAVSPVGAFSVVQAITEARRAFDEALGMTLPR